jgi:hypothetical protein
MHGPGDAWKKSDECFGYVLTSGSGEADDADDFSRTDFD